LHSAALLGAALMIAPPPVLADRDWDDDDRRGRYYRSCRDDDHHHRHKHHERHHKHGDWCAPKRYARPYVYYPPPRPYAYYGAPRHHQGGHRYYCEPCDHWYGTEVSFHYHLRHHHGIAAALLPAVIIGTVFGAIFAGH
jgi:hypothetical protein